MMILFLQLTNHYRNSDLLLCLVQAFLYKN
jgi:hypothetical protein